MSESRWSITKGLSTAQLTQVFSGGACNILSENATLLRNQERDQINDWLTSQRIIFYDPQIHPDTHGRDYDYYIHHPLEIAARRYAKINLYEVSPFTFGGVTSLELAADHFRYHEPMVIYYSDGNPDEDVIPKHSERGYPLFDPNGLDDKPSETLVNAHFKEMIKNANNMRRHLITRSEDFETLTITYGKPTVQTDVVITPDKMHATEIFRAMVRACDHELITVTFTEPDRKRDKKGNPMMALDENLTTAQKQVRLEEYVLEGNDLRREISQLVEVSVYVRVVYTQTSVIQALREVFNIMKIGLDANARKPKKQ